MPRRSKQPRFDASDPLLKGKHSPDGPVLLPRVRTLLKGALAKYVADWRLGDDGGSFVVRVR